jgi:hypothetical protein
MLYILLKSTCLSHFKHVSSVGLLSLISVKSNPLGLVGMSSIKFDLLLDRLNTNDLVGRASLKVYRGI